MASKFTRGLTPSQTVGPFFTTALTASDNNTFVSPVDNEVSGVGQKINLHGRVLDGNGDPISDALIEIWQADSQGNLTSSDFWDSHAAILLVIRRVVISLLLSSQVLSINQMHHTFQL